MRLLDLNTKISVDFQLSLVLMDVQWWDLNTITFLCKQNSTNDNENVRK